MGRYEAQALTVYPSSGGVEQFGRVEYTLREDGRTPVIIVHTDDGDREFRDIYSKSAVGAVAV